MYTDWEEVLEKAGVIWHHDLDLKRPFVLLTSEQISADFVDLSYAMAKPRIIAEAARELTEKLYLEYGTSDMASAVICGQMKGSTTLASRIAEEMGCGFIFTNKIGEGRDKKMVVDERFAGIHHKESTVILVEDVATTTFTSHLSRSAVLDFGFRRVSDILLSTVDRGNGRNEYGFKALSCFQPKNFRTWDAGQNPFTADGMELLPPIRAKTEAGRIAMHQVFT